MKGLIFLSLSLLACNSIAETTMITPEIVLQNIHRDGAEIYLRELAKQNATATSTSSWESIVENISSGDVTWLKIVPLIAGNTDAGFAEDIATALAQAIPKNARGVMDVINDKIPPVSISNVCSMPLYNETIPEKNEYFVKAVQALYKDGTPQAKKCLWQLINTVGRAGPFKMVD
ncbi:hypothetical protein V8O11_19750 [Erwinia aphidicola]|uniref:hypothetical protein n=1 Tax=Erwinia aphidicola TaxID=68334 RepID=UPI001DFB0D06|nr:hypothetical protein [Erwinia aphidicola]CAH0221890.1 hypothetical protein SRABI13_02234 [Erwinia aphidicola]